MIVPGDRVRVKGRRGLYVVVRERGGVGFDVRDSDQRLHSYYTHDLTKPRKKA